MRILLLFLVLCLQSVNAQQSMFINSYGGYNSSGVRREVSDAFFYGGLIDSLAIENSYNKLQQRNDLFDGTEIIVGTTRRMAELYFQNGFNIKKLKLFIVLGLEDQMRAGYKGYIVRLSESLPKCKSLFFTTNPDEERCASYLEEFYPNIRILELSAEA